METPKGPGDNCDDCGSELVQLNFCKRRLYEKERKPGKRREASDEQEQDAGNELALKLEVNDDDSSSTSIGPKRQSWSASIYTNMAPVQQLMI